MDPELTKTLIGAVVGIFGGGGLLTFLSQRHRPAIDKDTAVVANATDAGDLALAIAERADKRSEAANARMDVLEARLIKWVSWGSDLVYHWPVRRQSETPPELPE